MTTETLGGNIPDWDAADRMRKTLRTSGVPVQEMADYLGVSRNTVGNWINGHNEPSTQTLRLWALRTGVPYEWLRTGDVGPSDGPTDPDGQECPRQDSNLRHTVYNSEGSVVPFVSRHAGLAPFAPPCPDRDVEAA